MYFHLCADCALFKALNSSRRIQQQQSVAAAGHGISFSFFTACQDCQTSLKIIKIQENYLYTLKNFKRNLEILY